MAAKDQDPTLPAGALLGHWRIAKLLGEGGMGRVYLAEHNAIGRKVALKVLKKSLARSPELVERFFAEAHAVNRIRHPGIVEVTDCFIADDGTPCIVMELLIGKTVTEEMAATRLHPTRVAQIGAEVALALDAAHKAGVIHRDLKPDNLFLVDAERPGELPTVKVLDFGVAKLMDPMPNSTVHTVAGSIMGTPDYMAPEQLAGKPVDARADIYALGASLYHACTGRPPFPATNFGDLVVMHMTKPPTPPTCFANLPAVLEQVLLAMLEKDPARRPQTMGDVALLLRSAQKLGGGIELAPRGVDSRALVLAGGGAAGTLAPRLLPERVPERTGTEAFLAPLMDPPGLVDGKHLDLAQLPVVDGEVSGPVVLGELLQHARAMSLAGALDMPGPVGPPPTLPPPRAAAPSPAALALLPPAPSPSRSAGAHRGGVALVPARDLEGEARAVFIEDDSGSFPPSGTLLLGSAEAPELVDNVMPPARSGPLSSWLAPLAAQPRQSTPTWAWAALGAVLCFAALGAAWSVGQDADARSRGLVAKTAAASAEARPRAAQADAAVDPYAPLGGLAILEGAHGARAGELENANIAGDEEGKVRSDAPALTATVGLEPRVAAEPARVVKPLKKKKPVRAARTAAAPTGERRRAVLDPFAAERRR